MSFGIRRSTAWPNKPGLTEANLPDQSGKVFIVTGANSGIGKCLTGILYQHNANVYLAARSESKSSEVIKELHAAHPASRGTLHFLHLQLDDLSTIKKTADDFLAREDRLDVLWNNAGVMVPPSGSVTKQGHELQYGVNNLAHFLFTLLLLPRLGKTAESAPGNSVRVVWVSSSAADTAPKPAIDFTNMNYHREEGVWQKYGRSKAVSAIYAVEFARRTQDAGIINIALNPGNFMTNLQQNLSKIEATMIRLIASDPIKGAYTELFAGLSDSITMKDNAGWVSPFGKLEPVRKDFMEPEIGQKLWEWSMQQVKQFIQIPAT